jgi:hypothetical protein
MAKSREVTLLTQEVAGAKKILEVQSNIAREANSAEAIADHQLVANTRAQKLHEESSAGVTRLVEVLDENRRSGLVENLHGAIEGVPLGGAQIVAQERAVLAEKIHEANAVEAILDAPAAEEKAVMMTALQRMRSQKGFAHQTPQMYGRGLRGGDEEETS